MFVVSRNFAYRIEHYLKGEGAGRDEKVWTGISLYYSLGNSIKALTRHYRNFESGKVTGYRCTRMYPPFSGSEEELNKNWIPKALVKKVAASACAPFRTEIPVTGWAAATGVDATSSTALSTLPVLQKGGSSGFQNPWSSHWEASFPQ